MASGLLDEAQLTDSGTAEIRYANRSVWVIARARVERQYPFVLLAGERYACWQSAARGAQESAPNASPA